jgi:hypothetical protein
MAKDKHKQIITAVGTASWAKLKVQEEWKGVPTGKYSITVQFDQEYTQELLNILEKEYERLRKESPKFKDFKPARNTVPTFGDKELPNGDIAFKPTTKAEYKNAKTGEVLKRIVPVFDAKGRKIDVNIGNGSKVKLSLSIVPKCNDSKTYGVNIWLNAVQVIELVEYGATQGDADAFGFGVEQGFESEEPNEFDQEAYGENEEVEEGQVGDF